MDNSKIYGYLRISTDKQNIENNKKEILLMANNLGFNNNVIWIDETVTGTKIPSVILLKKRNLKNNEG